MIPWPIIENLSSLLISLEVYKTKKENVEERTGNLDNLEPHI